jgi:hypothetical protein
MKSGHGVFSIKELCKIVMCYIEVIYFEYFALILGIHLRIHTIEYD